MCRPPYKTTKDSATSLDNDSIEREDSLGRDFQTMTTMRIGEEQPSWLKRLSTENTSLLLLVISAASYSIMGCFVKLLTTTSDMSPIEIVFVRAFVQMLVVVTAMLFFTIPVPKQTKKSNTELQESTETPAQFEIHVEPLINHPFGLTKEIALLCIIRGICGGSGFCLYFYTISVLPLGDAVTILSLNPVITIMIAPIILKEPLTRTHLISAILSVTGSIFLARPPFLFERLGLADDEDMDTTATPVKWGYLTGVLGACTGAGVYIIIRKAGKKGVHTLNLLFSCCLFGMTAHFILNFAARLAPAGVASIIRSSGIIWSYLLEVLVFHQVPEALTIFGVGLIMISLGYIAFEKHQESVQQSNPHIPLASSEEDVEEDSSGLQLPVIGTSLPEDRLDGLTDTNNLHHRGTLSAISFG
ncbi:EamA-like transporter family protein [Nitzschia inconspicua]|uniref:EamA-like transporter family protein n=1 Tax=Nitzschia inconspicua TaxID=303405 RepID=A0A9K3PRL6_9STRA|nr:EamA-like transporter family protein [Nitzschia inconspicua]